MPIAIRHGWRTRVREAIAMFVTFAGGVVAATAGAGVMPRAVGGIVFAAGAYALLDALVLASSWRLVSDGMKIPTLAGRGRVIPDAVGLSVSPVGTWVSRVIVNGPKGTRSLTVNPLVSPHDVRDWFADISGNATDRGAEPGH